MVLALRIGAAGAGCMARVGAVVFAGAVVGVVIAVVTPEAVGFVSVITLSMESRAALALDPFIGLLALNSRHLAPSTIIILDTGIFGFLAAISGLFDTD